MTRLIRRLLLPLLALVLVLGPIHGIEAGAAPDEDTRPWNEQPFLGLSVRDTKAGLVVGWVQPGPLGGQGFESTSGIRRGDNLVSVDGEALDAAGFEKKIKAMKPGTTLALVLRRSPDAKPEAAVPKGGPGGETFEVQATLGSRDAWSGTIGRGLGDRTIPDAPEGAFEAMILEAAKRLGVSEGLPDIGGGSTALLAHLKSRQEKALDPNALAAVVQSFRRPLSVDAVEAALYAAVQKAASGSPEAIEALLRHVLDLEPSDRLIERLLDKKATDLPPPETRTALRFAGEHLMVQEVQDARAPVQALVAALRKSVYIYDDDAAQHVRVINDLAGPHVAPTLELALVLLRLAPAAWEKQASALADGEPLEEVPAGLRSAIGGDVLWIGEDPLGGLAVVGGKGPNRYDMSRVSAVYDVGGDDRYDYGEGDAHPLSIVIDLGGDDTHVSHAPFAGPATACYGLSWLDDRAGNDVYRSDQAFSVGAGLMGIGVLLDRAGNDQYTCMGEETGWGIGCGFWGAGLVLDQKGHDTYRGEILVEGVGGPRGLGLVLDGEGRDLYVANGPSNGSAYGTPAVYVGMSQGFGIGIRGYASGGLGAIYDLGGNDRYEAGEFSQAGGYYFGMGVMHDAAGHDLYYGNRYGQAFAAHQAIGVLVDDAGDDTYWSMTAASQAGTWDESIGLLLDRAGNDAYRCDGLGQGGASMQAVAMLIDLEGDDRYSGAGASIQGQGGGNSYHYDKTKIFSLSTLLDLGGGRDVYSSGRENDTETLLGEFRKKNPANSTLYGIFVDR